MWKLPTGYAMNTGADETPEVLSASVGIRIPSANSPVAVNLTAPVATDYSANAATAPWQRWVGLPVQPVEPVESPPESPPAPPPSVQPPPPPSTPPPDYDGDGGSGSGLPGPLQLPATSRTRPPTGVTPARSRFPWWLVALAIGYWMWDRNRTS